MQPFEDSALHRRLFHGRDEEIYELLNLVLAERIVLVFSRSGLGKSSLINAGLLEPLRERGLFPMSVRVGGPGPTPLDTLHDGIETAIGRAEADRHIECEPPLLQADRTSLWHFFKSLEIWQDDRLLSPVLIIDQFEELFTLRSSQERGPFIRELAGLVRGIRPGGEGDAPDRRYTEKPPDVTVVLVLREDFYANIEELRDLIPNIYKAPFRLTALSRDQARQAIVEPSKTTGGEFSTRIFSWTPEALELVLDFLSEQQLGEGRIGVGDDIEPFQLQLVCQHVEDLVRRNDLDEVTVEALGGPESLRSVLTDFYEEALRKICAAFPDRPDLRERLETLCEDGLVTARGRRLLREESTIQLDDGVPPEVLAKMVELRLLRKEPRIGDNYYELTHDTLIEPIRLSRELREQRRQEAEISGAIEVLEKERLQEKRAEARSVAYSSGLSLVLLVLLLIYVMPRGLSDLGGSGRLAEDVRTLHGGHEIRIARLESNSLMAELREALADPVAAGDLTVRRLDDNFIILRFADGILFPGGGNDLSAAFSREIAPRIGQTLAAEADRLTEGGQRLGRVIVLGHASLEPVSDVGSGKGLASVYAESKARAMAVLDAIRRNASADLRIDAEGRGADDPVCTPADERACWPQNRRVEILIENSGTETRPDPPRSYVPPPEDSRQLDGLRAALEPEIVQGLADVGYLDANFIIVRLSNRLLFPSGSAEVTEEFKNSIAKRIGEAFREESDRINGKGLPHGRVFAIGHSDAQPIGVTSRWSSNYELSGARATSVMNAIVAHAPPDLRTRVEARGPDDPICVPAEQPKCWSVNRRVELLIERTK